MQLSLLQSRLIASLAASLFILVLYLVLFSPNFALAAELDTAHVVRIDRPLERSEDGGLAYEPDFALFDRSIVGRAPPGVTALGNNVPVTMNLQPGSTECFMVEKSTIASRDTEDDEDLDSDGLGEDENGLPELKPRADSPKTIYLSVNTCLQPQKGSSDSDSSTPPQLTLFVSNSSDITCPNAATNDTSRVQSKVLKEGAAVYKIQLTGDVYIGVSAPNISAEFTGVYNFEIAASLEEYYHQIDESGSTPLLWMDSDSTSALLWSSDLTQDHNQAQQVLDAGPPYELFVENSESPSIDGLRHSICGLTKNAQISANRAGNGKLNNLVRTGMTTRGPGGFPKQQFYFTGLNSSSSYWGVLVKARKGSTKSKRQDDGAEGGGTVFAATQFNTSSGTNCKVVTDLEFCDEIQYAVPGNDDKLNSTELAKEYDNYAKEMYGHFETVLAQIPCEASAESRYSLARNCTDCRTAYKRWLCTVTIPRCEDLMSNSSFGIPRNIRQPYPNGTSVYEQMKLEFDKPYYNTSRNAFIDEKIQPGPYKEILPCEEICYEVVQACPAAMQFRCPQPHMPSFNASYGRRPTEGDAFTCNYPGEPRTKQSMASLVVPGVFMVGMVPLMMCLLLL